MATKATINKARALVIGIAQKGCEIDGLVAQLQNLKLTYNDYKTIRADFIGAYCEAKKADPKDKATNAAARKAWTRVLKAIGVEKPLSNSADAARKRTARQAVRASKTDEGEPVAPAKATNVGQKIKMELAPAEAHLVHLVRRGAIAAAVDYLHKLAESAEV